MRERLVRLVVILVVAFVTFNVAMAFSKKAQTSSFAMSDMLTPLKNGVDETAKKVLGVAVEKLSGRTGANVLNQGSTEAVEPIKEPAANIESKTQELIEAIKNLPQDQLEAIKKQLLKEVCNSIKDD